jgi:steroid delta-isomerase-like uncharacterized protein
MSAQQNEVTVRRLIDEVFNQGALDVLDELFAAEALFYRVGDGRPLADTPRRMRLFVGAYRAAFPDLQVQVDDLIAADDTVTVCWTMQGTHMGPFSHPEARTFGLPPTGRVARWGGTTVYHLAGGRITASRGHSDAVGLLRQLGLTITPAPATPEPGTTS